MDIELIFGAIQIAKSFYDHGRFDVFKETFPRHILREDSFYEFFDAAMDMISEFHHTTCKQEYGYDLAVYYHYFSSENMTAYVRLCRQYESLFDVEPKENPFWRDASTHIESALCLNTYSYTYGWGWKENTRKKYSSGIILAYDDNFDDDVGLIDGLLDIFTFFDQKLDTLKKAVEAAHANALCTERRAA